MLNKPNSSSQLAGSLPSVASRFGRGLRILSGLGILTFLTAGNCLANEESVLADEVKAQTPYRVGIENGRLSVTADTMPLVDLMKIVGDKADIKVVPFGEIDIETGPWSFTDVPLTRAIRNLLKGTNSVVSYEKDDGQTETQRISAVFILGAGSTETGDAEFEQVESVPTIPSDSAPMPSIEQTQQQAFETELVLRQSLSTDSASRVEAIDRLQGLSDDLTVTQLTFSLREDPDPEVRTRAIELLEEIGGTPAATALEAGLGDDDVTVRKNVVKALGTTQDERVPMWLGQVLMGDESADVRLQAVESIASQEEYSARIFLEAATDDESAQVSAAAVRLLE
jgi:hypothetical protein